MRTAEQPFERGGGRERVVVVKSLIDKVRSFFLESSQPINPDSERFRARYGNEMVDDDLAKVKKRKQDNAEKEAKKTEEGREQKQIADLFEALVNDLIGRFNWMGSEVDTFTSSDFDDLFNGVDVIAEIHEEIHEEDAGTQAVSHLALAVDVAFALDVSEKMKHIQENIDKGTLTRVKYFESDFLPPEQKGLSNVPRVVIGLEQETVIALGKMWCNEDREGNKEKIRRHGAQMVILKEVEGQLRYFAEYARMKNREEIAETYEKTLTIIRKIVAEKEKEGITAGDFEEDRVSRAILREARRLSAGTA